MKLKQRIESRGIKQTWIADQVGISKGLLNHYLVGRLPMPQNIEDHIKELLR